MRTQSYALPQYGILRELLRKTIHVTIALVPALAAWNMVVTVVLLCSGILFYVVNETARIRGYSGGLVSRMTAAAARPAEQGFVWGPVSLGLGALTALLYYPNPAASVAIYALAFGDGVASVVGKLWGRRKVFRWAEKTYAGSLGCFLAVLLSSYFVLGNLRQAVLAAAIATAFELVPVKDLDNLIIPLGTGFLLTLIL